MDEQDVKVNSWVNISAGTMIRYQIDGADSADFRFGEAPNNLEIGFHPAALRNFLRLGASALRELDAHAE